MIINTQYTQRVWIWLLDVIFPIRCIGCGKFGDYVCRGCLGSVAIKKTFECIGCKRNTSFGQTCFLCTKTNSVDQLLIVADFKNPLVEKTLKFFKYKFISDLEWPLSVLIKKYLKWLTLDKKFNVFETSPLLIPVPLHPRRLNWRGFNQSELLVQNIADTFQMEMVCDVIERTADTIPQADIKEKEERLKNLNGVFSAEGGSASGGKNGGRIKNREILLIDDVCTTGATLNECAKILKQDGVSRVVALVVARG